MLDKARKAAGPLLAKLGLGRDGKPQPGASKAKADQKVTLEDTRKAEHGAFTAEDRKAGLAAFAREERAYVKDGKINRGDANKVAGKVRQKHPVFQSINVIDGKDSWNYQYIFKAEAVDTPTQKAEGGLVDASSIRKYRPGWRKSIKTEFAAMYPELHQKQRDNLIAGFERRHITSYDQIKTDILNMVDGKPYQEAIAILGNKGYPPAKETNASILAAVKQYLRDKFNDVSNVFVGGSAENQARGRQMGAAKQAMKDARARGDEAAFQQAYESYRQQAFDPEPIDYFYDKYKQVRERV